MKPGHWAALAVALVLAAFLTTRVAGGGRTGGFRQPEAQPVPDDDLARLAWQHPDHAWYCEPDAHHHGYVYTPHRYPRVAGGEITALIHRGYSTMRIPRMDDVQWLIAPPSEAAF